MNDQYLAIYRTYVRCYDSNQSTIVSITGEKIMTDNFDKRFKEAMNEIRKNIGHTIDRLNSDIEPEVIVCMCVECSEEEKEL